MRIRAGKAAAPSRDASLPRRASRCWALLPLLLLLASELRAAEPLRSGSATGGTCVSSILRPGASPIFATRQARNEASDFENFFSLTPRFSVYSDGHWLVQGFRYGEERHSYAVAWGEIDARTLATFRSFLEEPEIRAWFVCNAGDPRSFRGSERQAGELLVSIDGSLRIVPAGRLLDDMRSGRAANRIVGMFRNLGDWIASLSSKGEALPDGAFVAYRTVTGSESFYHAINRSGAIPEWLEPPAFPGKGDLWTDDCRGASGSARFWCDGWSLGEARSCGAVDSIVDRVNRLGNVFLEGGKTREIAFIPLFPGLPVLEPSILLRQSR